MNQNYIILSNSVIIPLSEINFQTSRSSGPGSQNVNKLETRVQLIFNIRKSKSIPDNIRRRILNNLSVKVNSSGNIRIVVQESRSQWKNKQIAIKQLIDILESAIIIPKKRTLTVSTKASKDKRIKEKKKRSEIKKLRNKSFQLTN